MHMGDKRVAQRQCKAVLRAVIPFLDQSPRTFWVNHFAAEVAGTKPLQLRLASEAGLVIPETLITNNPHEIREFIRRQGGFVAHKLLEPSGWRSEDGKHLYLTYTSTVTEPDLPSDDLLRLCPAILQPLLKKEFEIRVLCLGDFLVAVRLNSQEDERAAVDWRAGQFRIAVQPYELPEETAAGCRRLMRSLRIVHGSIDFVVDPTGKHIFLEVNPQGQFLWMEDRTGLPVLDMFAEFLLAGKREFVWRGDHRAVSLNEFARCDWERVSRAAAASHCRNTRSDELIVPDADISRRDKGISAPSV